MRWAGRWRGIRIKPASSSASSIRAKVRRCEPSASNATRNCTETPCNDTLSQQAGLTIGEGTVDRLLTHDGSVTGVVTDRGDHIQAKAVILTSGTFLKGLIHIGLNHFPAGRAGEASAEHLSDCMRDLGFEVGRLKTGTPPRLDGDDHRLFRDGAAAGR